MRVRATIVLDFILGWENILSEKRYEMSLLFFSVCFFLLTLISSGCLNIGQEHCGICVVEWGKEEAVIADECLPQAAEGSGGVDIWICLPFTALLQTSGVIHTGGAYWTCW